MTTKHPMEKNRKLYEKELKESLQRWAASGALVGSLDLHMDNVFEAVKAAYDAGLADAAVLEQSKKQ